MESSRIALTALLALASLALVGSSPDLPTTGTEAPDRRREVARLRAHFDSVDSELRHAEALHLTPDQRTARVTLVGWLRDYREAGTFPRNDRFPDRPMPFFRDRDGVLCAMAYLIERSGRGDLVDRVASTRNNGFIPELVDDPDLRAWLDSVGLSVAEAARIQPQYEPPPETVPEDDAVSADYALTSIVASGSSLTTLGLNLISSSRSTGWAGIIAGSAAIVAGVANLDGTEATEQVATANVIAGTSALAVGLYRLVRPRPARSFESGGENAGTAIRPAVMPTSDGPRLGLAVHTSF